MKKAVNNVKTELKNSGQVLKKSIKGPMSIGYYPEIAVSPEMGTYQANYYQNLIGFHIWKIGLGSIDIQTDFTLLLCYLASSRRGHT